MAVATGNEVTVAKGVPHEPVVERRTVGVREGFDKPRPGEVRIDKKMGRLLRSATSTERSREVLGHALMTPEAVVATDGQVLLRLRPEATEYAPGPSQGRRWLVHRDVFSWLRTDRECMFVDLQTGAIEITGPGAGYPVLLPPATPEGGDNRYPDWARVMPPEDRREVRMRLGERIVAFVQEAARVAGSVQHATFGVPVTGNAELTEEEVVTTAIRMDFAPGVDGLIMPMRIG